MKMNAESDFHMLCLMQIDVDDSPQICTRYCFCSVIQFLLPQFNNYEMNMKDKIKNKKPKNQKARKKKKEKEKNTK